VVADLGAHALTVASTVLAAPVTELYPQPGTRHRGTATATIGDTPAELSVGWDAVRPRFTVSVEGTRGSARIELLGVDGPRSGELHWQAVAALPHREVLHRPPVDARLADPCTEGAYRGFVRAWRTGQPGPTELTRVADCLRYTLRWAGGLASAADSVAGAGPLAQVAPDRPESAAAGP
jgi:hypothetical protein